MVVLVCRTQATVTLNDLADLRRTTAHIANLVLPGRTIVSWLEQHASCAKRESIATSRRQLCARAVHQTCLLQHLAPPSQIANVTWDSNVPALAASNVSLASQASIKVKEGQVPVGPATWTSTQMQAAVLRVLRTPSRLREVLATMQTALAER
jgi:hypothetical protein